MLDLGLSILSASLIFVAFKLFSVCKVHAMYGIIVNYMVASVVGILFSDRTLHGRKFLQALVSRDLITGSAFYNRL